MMERIFNIEYSYLETWKDLDTEDLELANKAFQICREAYAPYSKFKVGAALRLDDGEIILGNNQENIAYPSGLCAERVALFYAGANFPNKNVRTICIVAKGDLVSESTKLSPCGGCRQVMLETEGRQKETMRVILINQDDTVTIFNRAKDLLPLAFGIVD